MLLNCYFHLPRPPSLIILHKITLKRRGSPQRIQNIWTEYSMAFEWLCKGKKEPQLWVKSTTMRVPCLNCFKYLKCNPPEQGLNSESLAFKSIYLNSVWISLIRLSTVCYWPLIEDFLGSKSLMTKESLAIFQMNYHYILVIFLEIGFSSSIGKIFILMNREVRTKSSEFITETAKVSIHKGVNMYWLIEDPKNLKLKSDAKTATEPYSKRNTSTKLSQRLVFLNFS